MKRIFAAALAALMLLSFAACSGDGSTGTETTAAPAVSTTAPVAETTAAPDTSPKPELPTIRFDETANPKDKELVIIHGQTNVASYAEIWIGSEGLDGDIINDAIFRRNNIVEEKYGIKIVSMQDANVPNTVALAGQAQTDEYDVAMMAMRHLGNVALKGFLYNLNELPYINYEMPWWDTNCYNNTIVDNKIYGMVSDISMMTLAGVRGIIFNRDLAKNYQLEDPYTLVKEDRWTLDKMTEMSLSVSTDLNGDQQFTDADVYGILVEDYGANANILHLIIASGIQYVDLVDNNEFKVAYANEKTINVMEKCRKFLLDPTTSLTYSYLNHAPGLVGTNWTYGRVLFASDHFLFMQGAALLFDELNTNSMESEYGIVPNPKYDDAQEEYYHLVDTYTSMLTIPAANDIEDMERIAVLIEDLAYQSSKTVKTAYYDTVIKLRRATVPELGEMMDIIKNSIGYQYENVYKDMDVNAVVLNAFTSGSTASAIESGLPALTLNINRVLEKIKNLP